MTNVFGLIVSGRLVQTDFTPVSATHTLVTIPEADHINHVVVFLTGAAPLAPGALAVVYWSWPDPAAPPNWQPLGYISNSKPSAIFKLSSLKKLHELSMQTQFSSTFGQQKICHNAQLGIAIEPEENAQLLDSSLRAGPDSHATFAEKMLENLVNFVASFAVSGAEVAAAAAAAGAGPAGAGAGGGGGAYVPLATLHTWYQNFERRLRQNPNFWKN